MRLNLLWALLKAISFLINNKDIEVKNMIALRVHNEVVDAEKSVATLSKVNETIILLISK